MYKKIFLCAVLVVSVLMLCGCKFRIASTSSSVTESNSSESSSIESSTIQSSTTESSIVESSSDEISSSESTVEVYDFTYTLNGGIATITGLTNYNIHTLAVPNIIGGYPVGAISLGAFSGCTNLVSLTIPFVGETKDGSTHNNFCYIFGASNYNFNDDYIPASLRSVSILSSTRLASYSFAHCSFITSIILPDDMIYAGDDVFYNCSALEYNIYDNAKYLGTSTNNYFFLASKTSTSISACSINQNCKIIGDQSFLGCLNLTSIDIPQSVIFVHRKTFIATASLASLNVNSANAKYKSDQNCIIEKDTNILVLGCNNSTIPSYITEVGSWAFAYCETLSSANIPEGVTSIGDHAFYDCSNLSDLTIPSTLTYLGPYSFLLCKVSSIILPEGITAIYEVTFQSAPNLTSIVIPSGVTSIGNTAFQSCDALTTIFYGGTTETEWNAIYKGSSNEPLASATKYYYSETQPLSGNYWHFVSGVPTIWVV